MFLDLRSVLSDWPIVVPKGRAEGVLRFEGMLCLCCPVRFRSQQNEWRRAVGAYRAANRRGWPENWILNENLTRREQRELMRRILLLIERRRLSGNGIVLASALTSLLVERPLA